jgi:hypothetical protein
MSSKIKIACPHETGEIKISKVVSDYHPLNKREITNLLDKAAKNSGNVAVVSEIQVRLNQGIVGITCPRPITGKVVNRLNELDNLFMKKYKEGSSPDTVDRLYQIMAIN